MDYRKLLNTVLLLLSQPAKAWRSISVCEGKAHMFNDYLYPIIMLCSLATLIGTLFTHDFGFESFYFAAVKMGVQFATLFFAYHLLAFFIAKISSTYMKVEYDRQHTDKLTAYSMVVIFLLEILLALFPNFRIIGWILQFYTVKIVWDGAAVLMRVPEERRFTYTMAVSLLVMVIPFLMGTLMSGLSTNLG
ncbi:MAG: DUF1282 family protein [Bacteroidaceae bacterium]|nr:DUF1282 family protein [Bacteroidaceae bacterium]